MVFKLPLRSRTRSSEMVTTSAYGQAMMPRIGEQSGLSLADSS